ncbi:TolC family protein [Anabaena sp. FACHB-1237]|uniref:TolC family protein n=1 Tax=Anabaena sp. FACHB-1237 TaxID=2692769 RepID=UPI00168082C7|nr:TolC family protein [Anabaena sp. FACHB-1237]MBD2139295.1 TolC family protein [Anabaena sp. FACHB-1237]
MKGQQIFHCFLPGVTVAILTTQPALANSVTVSGVKPTYPSGMVVSTNGGNLSTSSKLPLSSKMTTGSSWGSDDDLSAVVAVKQTILPVIMTNKNDHVNSVKLWINNNDKVVNIANKSHNDCSLSSGKNPGGCKLPTSLGSSISQVTVPIQVKTVIPSSEPENPSEKVVPITNNAQDKPVTSDTTQRPGNTEEKPADTPEATQVSNSLDPSPNPLLFPTQDEEVKIQRNQPLTLEQALELARKNNNDLQRALLELNKSKSVLKEAQAALLPSVDLSATLENSRSAVTSLRYDQEKNTNPSVGDAPSNTDFTGRAQLTYNLYTSGKRNAVIREAEERIKVQELEVERQSEEIRLNVAKAYYDLQQADEQVRISDSAVKNSEASLKDANALERAGVGTKFDVLRSQVSLANAKQDLTNALSDREIARRRLVPLLNLPQSMSISAADPVKLAGLWQHSLEKSIVLAYQNRPELQQNLAQRNIGEAQRKQAMSSLGPQVSLVARYDVLDQFNDNTSISDGYSVGVQATLSLYDGGSARAKAAQAKSDIAIAETKFSEQRNQIRFQVEQAYSTQLSSLENVQTSKVALEQAKESLRLARLRFQAGVGTQTDVINAENDLTRSEGNHIKAILDYNRALTELQRYVTQRGVKSVSQ